jgi:hypothetical protein
MPPYGSLPPTALYPGDSALAFNAEKPNSGVMSQAFAISPSPGAQAPSVSIEVDFAAAPGAFEFDIYESDTDVSTKYIGVPAAMIINSVNASNHAKVDLAPFLGTFIAILSKIQNANAVNATVKITRRG